eukprot:UN20609
MCPMECDQDAQIIRSRDINCIGTHGLLGDDYLCIDEKPTDTDFCPFNKCSDDQVSSDSWNEDVSENEMDNRDDGGEDSNNMMIPMIITGLVLVILCTF